MAKTRIKTLAEEFKLNIEETIQIAQDKLSKEMITGKGKGTWVNEEGVEILKEALIIPEIVPKHLRVNLTTRGKAIDMSTRNGNNKKDITSSRKWRNEQIDRLAAWEMFCRYIRHEHTIEMSHRDMCDRIGMPKDLIRAIIQNLKNKLNG